MTRLPPDFKEFIRLLNSHNVDYLLIDGYAVALYGYPRATADMDVWIAVRPDNARKLKDVLVAFGFAEGSIDESLFLAKGPMFRMGVPPLRIELLTEISGVSFDECHRRRHRMELDGVQVDVISLDDLKANKKAGARHKDLDDLAHL